jgi:hypothetical protein
MANPERSPINPPEIQCPWCPYTDTLVKKVIQHMESAHYRRWCDLALYPPIAGGNQGESPRPPRI